MTRLCKVQMPSGLVRVGSVDGDTIALFPREAGDLSSLLAAPNPAEAVDGWIAQTTEMVPVAGASFLPPIDRQEVWAAGVTYRRSQQARMEESEQAASFYDKVYTADRPELFFKATANRVTGPGEPVRVRKDTRWCVPEPEITLVLSPALHIVGFTIGNDMSARDIEGENPLYLPQAKLYRQCAGLGPVITLADSMPARDKIEIQLTIERGGKTAFEGETSVAAMRRSFEELVEWLGRDNEFPEGAFLMTGTGIVPPDDFSLTGGDIVTISITGIGSLRQPVVSG